MDEEIMDFQWFDNISWDSIKDLRGTTNVQPPPRFKFALQQVSSKFRVTLSLVHCPG